MAQQIGNLKIKCPEEGCLWRGSVANMNDHNKDGPHLSLSITNDLDSGLSMAATVTGSSRRLAVLEAKTQEQDEKIASLEATINGQCDVIEGLRILFDGFNNQMEDLQSRHGKRHEQVHTIFEPISQDYKKEHIWKIPDYNASRKAAVTAKETKKAKIESAPFFIKPGYKFKLLAYLNGYEEGYRTHCSVFIRMVRREFDGSMEWPFNKSIELTIVNQKDKRRNVTECISRKLYTIPGGDEIVKRPRAATNEYVAGFYKLISLDRLNSNEGFIKLDPHYCDVIIRRREKFSGQEAVLDGDGQTFGQIEND